MQNIDDFQKLQKEEKASRIYFNNNDPVCIRFDGKNITKDHKHYPLTTINGFTHQAFLSAQNVLGTQSGIIYAGLDEVSVIFTDPAIFWCQFDDRNKDYAMGLLLQTFVKSFYKYYPEVYFGTSMFTVKDPLFYLHTKQALNSNNSIVYIAKDFLSVDKYHNVPTDDILKNLNRYAPEAVAWMMENPWFQDGYCKVVKNDRPAFIF